MRLMIRTLAVALLALLAATPTNAVAAKPEKVALGLSFDSYTDFQLYWYGGTFQANGAIKDSGPVADSNWFGYLRAHYLLQGKDGDLAVFISFEEPDYSEEGRYDLSGSFTIVYASGAYAGLSGSGTATGTLTLRQRRYSAAAWLRWRLNGTLGGG